MPQSFRRLKAACYATGISQSVTANLSPILFITFRSLYGISYSLLGLLVLINFVTQLTIDLIFSFFSHKFDIPKTVRATPLITAAGLFIYAVWPFLFPDAVYIGLVIGTVVFSLSSGLAEVLISPVIAQIPADDPDREMSRLHSMYAWGVVGVILVSTLWLWMFGQHAWQWLALFFMLLPLFARFLYSKTTIPPMKTQKRVSGALKQLKNKTLLLCVFGIFLGGAAECVMAQWSSGYLEQALMIPKLWGDIFGTALFSVMLGLGRSLYAEKGRNPERVLILGTIGAVFCYLTAALCGAAIIGLLACAFTGFCVSMLWPGSLIAASDRIPDGGVFMYAMMAAGGDLGASVGPQLVGFITDMAMGNEQISAFAVRLGYTSEQFGLKLGMLTGILFPLIGIFVFIKLKHIVVQPKKTHS